MVSYAKIQVFPVPNIYITIKQMSLKCCQFAQLNIIINDLLFAHS